MQQAERPRHRRLQHRPLDEVSHLDNLAQAPLGDQPRRLVPLRPASEDAGGQLRQLALGQRDGLDRQRHPLLADQPGGEHHHRLGRLGLVRRQIARVEPFQHLDVAVDMVRAQSRRRQLGQAERVLAHAKAKALHRPADAAESAEVAAPIVARPEFQPVDHDAVSADRPGDGGGEQGEVGE